MDLEKFLKIIKESFDGSLTQELNEKSSYEDLDWDSLSLLTLIDSIDMEFGVLLKREDIELSKSLKDLYDLVKSKL